MFYHPGRDLSMEVHGDDFMAVGWDGDVRWLADEMAQWFEIKGQGHFVAG